MQAQSAELQSKIAVWRQKSADGTMTKEEYREAIAYMRAERKTAATTSSSASRSKVAKAKEAIPSADDMLGEIG